MSASCQSAFSDDSIKRAKETENVLQDALMSWTKKRQHDYLKTLHLPISGTKEQLASRIMSKVTIKNAVKITREYRLKKLEESQHDDNGNGGKHIEIPDVDIEKMKIALKRKRESGTQIPNKVNVQDSRRVSSAVTLQGSPNGVEIINDKTNGYDTDVEEGQEGNENFEEQELSSEKNSDINDEKDEEVVITKVNSPKKNNPIRDDDSMATTKADNVTRTRIGLMVNTQSSKEPDKCLALVLQKWFNKMQELDKKFTVISWRKGDGPRFPIKEAKSIPNVISKLRIYFHRIQARSAGGRVFADVFVHHSIPMDDLKGDMEWFLKENQMAIYKKQLQVEETAQLGWLLYSTQALDNDTLSKAIEAEIGVEVALRWKYINSSKYLSDESERKKWMATHIEVEAKVAKKASRGLKRIYGSKSTLFPLGIRMRLVSEFREVKGNSSMMGKHTRLRVRQASFISLIDGYPSDDIQMLDYEDNGTTLRKMVMTIQSRNPKTPGNLFHAIGTDWRGRIIFNFLRSKAEEATMIVDGLIPYLQYQYDNTINLFFDPEAVVEKEQWQWDNEKGIMITPLSEELDGLDAIDNDYDFTVAMQDGQDFSEVIEGNGDNGKEDGNNNKTTAEEQALARLNLIVTGKDTDSVSTLGNPMTPANLKKARMSNMISIRTSQTDTSSVTNTSIDTRMSVIEQRISSMEQTITNSLEISLAKIMEKMSTTSSTSISTQPPGGESAGRENE